MKRSRRTLAYLIIGLVILLILFGQAMAAWLVDIYWFQELGYLDVFWRIFSARLILGLAIGVLTTGVILSQLRIATKTLTAMPLGLLPPAIQRLLLPRSLFLISLFISGGFGVVVGSNIAGEWELFELFRHGGTWGLTDPIFYRDLSFFLFKLPVYQLLLQIITLLTLLSLLLSAGVYTLSGSLSFVSGSFDISIHPRARTHLGVLIATLFLAKAVGYWLGTFELVHSLRGKFYGAGYTDIHANLPALRILIVIALISALVSLWSVSRRRLRPLLYAIGTWMVASLLLGGLWPALMQRIIVDPNEQTLERPYIEHNIAFTRRAFGLEDIEVREFPASNRLTTEMIDAHRATIENIRLWDVRPLSSTYRQRQNIRQYYDFYDIDVDRYTIGDRYVQTLVAARELDHNQLEPGANTWTNVHLRFTHGYGAVMSPAAKVAAGGQPEFYLQDIPPQSPVGIEITRPEIYFGEIDAPYALVRTKLPEIDHPSGDTLATTFYEGTAGIHIGNLWRKLLFSFYLGDYNLLLSSELTAESRILINRQIINRVKKIAPFLQYDRDPYLVIGDDGRLFWMIDAYTISRNYPYSQPYSGDYAPPTLRGINYIRNSVKAVVDAYNGTVYFYTFVEDDPLLAAYSRIFPTLFKPASEMPADLRSHARYPEDMFRVQADVYTLYHMVDPEVFYNREDVWQLPRELLSQEPQPMDPYYLIMTLEDGSDPEFLLMLPFTPATRENMIAWMAGRSDGHRLGELFVFQLPKDRQIFGPMQVENRINQQDEIAQNLALWSRQGTNIIRGSLLVIPIGETLLYVEPLYLRSSDGGLPELRRVIVSYGDHEPVMERSLWEALARLVGSSPGTGVSQQPSDPGVDGRVDMGEQPPQEDGSIPREDALLRRARELYDNAMSALRNGDFARYAEYIEELGDVLRELTPN